MPENLYALILDIAAIYAQILDKISYSVDQFLDDGQSNHQFKNHGPNLYLGLKKSRLIMSGKIRT
jgi:Mg2+ and Co2+ transporter CorA